MVPRAVVWPFVDEASTRLREIAGRRGYLDSYGGSTAQLAIEWPSFDDYVGSRSKSLRRTIRGELRSLAERGIRTSMTTDFRAYAGEMAALYRATTGNHRGRTPARSRHHSSSISPRARRRASGVNSTFHQDRLVGSSISVAAGGVMEGTFAAFAPGFLGGSGLPQRSRLRAAASRLRRRARLPRSWPHRAVPQGAARWATALGAGRSRSGCRLRCVPHCRTLGPLVARRTEWKERQALGSLGTLEALAAR